MKRALLLTILLLFGLGLFAEPVVVSREFTQPAANVLSAVYGALSLADWKLVRLDVPAGFVHFRDDDRVAANSRFDCMARVKAKDGGGSVLTLQVASHNNASPEAREKFVKKFFNLVEKHAKDTPGEVIERGEVRAIPSDREVVLKMDKDEAFRVIEEAAKSIGAIETSEPARLSVTYRPPQQKDPLFGAPTKSCRVWLEPDLEGGYLVLFKAEMASSALGGWRSASLQGKAFFDALKQQLGGDRK